VLEPRKPCLRTAACSPQSPTSRLVGDCHTSSSVSFILHFRDVLCPLAVFSDRFSEGVLKNLRDGFPSNEEPYTDSYEYSSDSDLDEEEDDTETDDEEEGDTETDEEEDDTETDEPLSDNSTTDSTRKTDVVAPDQARRTPSLAAGRNDAERATATASDSGSHPGTAHIQLGKVAIIRDVAAAT